MQSSALPSDTSFTSDRWVACLRDHAYQDGGASTDCAHHKRSIEVRCRGCCWTLAAQPWREGLKRDLIQRSLLPEMVESALALGHCNNVDVLSDSIGLWMTTASTSATPIERVIALGVTMTPNNAYCYLLMALQLVVKYSAMKSRNARTLADDTSLRSR